jgi:hypothetical protein
MQDSEFLSRPKEAKLRLIDGAISELRNNARGAVNVLVSIANDANNPPSARVAAARAIVTLAIECGQVEDIENRLKELEIKTITATPEWKATR